MARIIASAMTQASANEAHFDVGFFVFHAVIEFLRVYDSVRANRFWRYSTKRLELPGEE